MHPHEKHPSRHDLEPSGKSVAFFLTLPVVFLVLLFLSLACEDSGRAARGGEDSATAVAPERDPASTPSRTLSRPERPEPPLESTDEVAESTAPAGPVTYETAEAAYLEGRYDEATSLFGSYVERRPENPWGHYMLGLSAWKAGDRVSAERALRETVEIAPGHRKGWVNLARVLLDDERPGEARQAVDSALALEPERSDALRVLGLAREAAGELDAAAEAYRRALTVDPEDAWSMNNLGLMHIRRGHFEEALPPLARAVRVRDDVPVFHNNLGVALERTGRFAQAAEAYRKARELPGGHPKAETSLARVEGLAEPEGMEPVELASLAREFADAVDGWRQERMAGSDAASGTDGPEPSLPEHAEQEDPESEQAPPEDAVPEGEGDGAGEGSPAPDPEESGESPSSR